MKAEERRKKIARILMTSEAPVSGGAFSELLGASRQIIVQDIAVLRASGYDILSTHTGYVMREAPRFTREFKVRHTSEETPDELSAIVNEGAFVEDVFVHHKIYGKLSAKLNIATAEDVDNFTNQIKSEKSLELMHITAGYHYHTVRADTEDTLLRVESALRQKGYLVEALLN